jgi:hypothetical protein
LDYNEISEKFLGKNVTQAAKDAALEVPIKDEWSDEARKAAAEARKNKEPAAGKTMRFNGRSVKGDVEGSMPVRVVNPHSNAHLVTHTKGGREYEGAYTHLRTATVERPAHKERPARQFEAYHHTLSEEK